MPINREHVFKMIKDGRTAILLGGDIELYDGMRKNSDIIRELAVGCNYPEEYPHSLPEVGEYFAELNGFTPLVEKVASLVDTTPGDSSLLRTIAKVESIADIFTTTMDKRIESFFPLSDLVVVNADTDVPRALSRKRRLYRLNGTIAFAERMILTKSLLLEQLSAVPKSALVAHLACNLAMRQFLIIGHDLNEWNFRFFLEQVNTQLGKFCVKSILFCANPDPVWVSFWNKKNIEVVPESPEAFLSDYLVREKQL